MVSAWATNRPQKIKKTPSHQRQRKTGPTPSKARSQTKQPRYIDRNEEAKNSAPERAQGVIFGFREKDGTGTKKEKHDDFASDNEPHSLS